MYFQNLDIQKKILKSLDDNGLAVIKNFIDNKKILDIKKKVKKRLNNINYLPFCLLNLTVHSCHQNIQYILHKHQHYLSMLHYHLQQLKH